MVHSAPGGPFDEEKAVSPEVLIKLNESGNTQWNVRDRWKYKKFQYAKLFLTEHPPFYFNMI